MALGLYKIIRARIVLLCVRCVGLFFFTTMGRFMIIVIQASKPIVGLTVSLKQYLLAPPAKFITHNIN